MSKNNPNPYRGQDSTNLKNSRMIRLKSNNKNEYKQKPTIGDLSIKNYTP